MTRRHLSLALTNVNDRRTQKNELLRLCARVGFTPPGALQP
jgi:hypothetical protein